MDNLNARVEASTDRKRAKTKGEVKLIENIVEYGVQQLGASPEFAERAFNAHFRKVLAAQENKDGVLLVAKRDLEENPPAEDIEGDISEDFFARFEQHAEAASTDDMRQLFGRILSGEIRKPGTVSTATLRLYALLDEKSAALIEKVCSVKMFPSSVLKRSAKALLSRPELTLLRDVGFFGDIFIGENWTMKWAESDICTIMVNDTVVGAELTGTSRREFETFPITFAGQGLANCLNIQLDLPKLLEDLKAEGATALFLGKPYEADPRKYYRQDMHCVWRSAN